jgi:two-component system aerobic respiration control sensor histidine kinase ArcB
MAEQDQQFCLNKMIVFTDNKFIIDSVNQRLVTHPTLNLKIGDSIEEALAPLLDANEVTNLLKSCKKNSVTNFKFAQLNVSIIRYHHHKLTFYVFIFESEPVQPINSLVQEYISDIIRYSPGFIYLKDTQFKYLICNENFAKVAGLDSPEKIKGKTDYDLVWKETQADLFRQSDIEALSGIPKINFEEPQLQADGSTKILLANKVPLYDSQKNVIGILGNYLDITQRKKLEKDLIEAKEKAESASRAKSDFLENMRHDIRTPLTGIVGFSDIIKTEAQSPNIAEYADNLVASSHALLDLLDEVLEAIQVSSGEIPLLKKKFSLQKTLQHVFDLNKAKAASKRLEYVLEFDKNLPKYVIGDNVRLYRIALELIANALNFTDSGFVTVKAGVAQSGNGQVIVRMLVQDSGVGIPDEKQQEIFLQFTRLTPSYKGIYKGAGLGLSVVKQFIEDMGGEIYVQSTVNQGTSFTCILPLGISLLQTSEGTDDILHEKFLTHDLDDLNSSLFESHNENQVRRILVVEDNFIAQTVAKSMLAKFDCQVDIAEDGNQAIRMWKQNHYDLIFMDIGLPDMEGYEVTHQIRVQELAKRIHTPIIALTAHAGEENKQRCIEAGMNAVLTKPLTQKSCKNVLSSFISGGKRLEEVDYNSLVFDLPKNLNDLFDLDSYPLLDFQDGLKNTGNQVMLKEMLTLMLEQSLPEDLVQLKNARQHQDWESVQHTAHKIKGGAVYVGTVRMKMACQYLERYWKSGQRDLLDPLYEQALSVINDTLQEIKAQS